ncbi:MAG: tetratricopeptide repeat protein [Chitinophagales bacterium]|nr:tetratricopeptide repeat protein [Chitinophagales bacterium]
MSKPKPTQNKNTSAQGNRPLAAPQAPATDKATAPVSDKWWRQPKTLMCLGLILALTALAFARALGNDFINWDDPDYVYESEFITSLSAESLRRMFTESIVSNYHPLSILSLAIDYTFSGLKPFGYHLSNYILHLINVVLVFVFTRRVALDYWQSDANMATDTTHHNWQWRSSVVGLIVAVLFAIHPLHVESVAWVSERKDMLYTLFMLPAFIAYMNYRKTNSKAQYVAALFFYLLSLLSKPSAVVFPILLLCLDYLHRRAWSMAWLIEKIPFFALSFLFGIITINVQVDTAIGEFAQYSIPQRICFASYGFVMYIIKLFFPTNQSVLYPYPILTNGLPPMFMIAPLLALGIVAATVWSSRSTRIVAFGLLFYFFNIALVLQFMSVGEAIMSERYTYMSYFGLFFILAMLYDYISQKNGAMQPVLLGILGLVSLSFAYKTHDRLAVWKNSEILWTNVIDQYPNRIPTAHNNRGHYRRQHDRPQEALQDLSMAIQLHPKYHLAFVNRGNTYFSLNKNDEALADYNKAIELKPDYAESYGNRGSVYFQKQQYDLAMADYNKALELKKHYPDAYLNRAVTYSVLGKHELAKADYDAYIATTTDNAKAYYWRGLANRHLKMIPQSLPDFDRAIQLDPKNGEFYLHRSYTHKDLGNTAAAEADVQKAKSLGIKVP